MKTTRNLAHFRGEKCLNCSTPLDVSDRFCNYCGQINSQKKLAFNDFFNEFFAGLFAYDSKIYRTISALLFKPGKISLDYINGKRNTYVNPFRFYLSVSIIFFIIVGFTSNSSELAINDPQGQDLSTTTTGQEETANFASEEELSKFSGVESFANRFDTYYTFYKKEKILNPEEALKQLGHSPTDWNLWTYRKAANAYNFVLDPSMFVNYFMGKLPFIIFFYLPVFAFFIWMLYLRRPFTYMEHLVFTFHNQTLAFLLFIAAVLIDEIFALEAATGVAILLFLFYLYKAMRRFYSQNRFKTVVKFVILNGIFFILAVCAGIFALFASFAMF